MLADHLHTHALWLPRKHFDLVNHDVLFRILGDDLNPVVLRFSKYWNGHMRATSIGKCVPEEFRVTNGVRHVGILSLLLFAVYLN